MQKTARVCRQNKSISNQIKNQKGKTKKKKKNRKQKTLKHSIITNINVYHIISQGIIILAF